MITFDLDNNTKQILRLEKFIEKCYENKQHPNMTESKTEPISKRKRDSSTDTDDFIFSPPGMVKVETDLLNSINDKLGILEFVSKDVKELKASLEMSDEKAATLEKETHKLKGTVNKIETEVNELKKENIVLKKPYLTL